MNELIKYLVVGFTSITVFSLLFYLAPLILVAAIAILILFLMSVLVGYLIVESYDIWRDNNGKNKSGKKTPPSKDA